MLHKTGMVKKAHIKRVLCHLSGTYVGAFNMISPWRQSAERKGTAAQRLIQEKTLLDVSLLDSRNISDNGTHGEPACSVSALSYRLQLSDPYLALSSRMPVS